jgi:hypothetical protein
VLVENGILSGATGLSQETRVYLMARQLNLTPDAEQKDRQQMSLRLRDPIWRRSGKNQAAAVLCARKPH